jgi:uncharacterized protein (DUF1778 family)/GNAT superfamily N-acetyltransferase
MPTSAARTTIINLRADAPRRALIDRAAKATGKNRSEFMLDAATREATSVLLDRRFFELDPSAFKRFTLALDAPPADNARLRRLLEKKAPWERVSTVSAPEHFDAQHDIAVFDSGVPELDTWLKRRALQNEASGASRTYVVTAEGRVVGYYALATGAVAPQHATGKVRRNMPEPIPVMILGRLAVDRKYQGRGLGSALLKDGLRRTLNAAAIVGIRAVLLHAVSEAAKRFYEHAGFASSPVDPMTMMLTLADAQRASARCETPP